MKKVLIFILMCFMLVFLITGCGMAENVSEDMSTMMTDVSEAIDGDKNNGKVTDSDGVIEENNDNDRNNEDNANLNDGVGDPVVNNTESTSTTNKNNNSRSSYNDNYESNGTSSTSYPDSIV